jgi:putative ABC transport system ATP-binding protein
MAAVTMERAGKVYGTQLRTRALAPTDLSIELGEIVLLLGPSGSGKTTLLNLLGALDCPSEGEVILSGYPLSAASPRQLTLLRREAVGFVFQFFNLVPSLTAVENVFVAAELIGGTLTDAQRELARVGLEKVADRFPSELSGGQQQRVAIARALVKRPRLLLADEPSGALDHEAGREVAQLLRSAAHEQGSAVVVVTHDESLIEFADRVLRIRDGVIRSDERRAPAVTQTQASP